MTDNSNQGSQAAPVVAPATTVTPTAVVATPNPASPEAAAALAAGGNVPPVQSTSPVVESTPAPPVAIGEPDANAEGLTATEEGDIVVYDTTGDPGMDMALSFVGRLGLKPDHPAMAKAAEGDFSFIKAHLATLGDKAKGWEQHIALAEQAYGNQVKTQQALTQAITTSVHREAGGPAQWAAIEAWAKANADPKERDYINKMLADNPVSAQAAVILLKRGYEKATGTTVEPANPLKGDTPSAEGAKPDNQGPLSRKEYAKAVIELNRRKPGAVDRKDPEYLQLQQRARAYKG